MTKSEFKLEEFNNCRPNLVLGQISAFDIEYVDLPKDFWQNTGDTLVFKTNKTDFQTGIELGNFAVQMSADEIHMIKDGYDTIIRLWFD